MVHKVQLDRKAQSDHKGSQALKELVELAELQVQVEPQERQAAAVLQGLQERVEAQALQVESDLKEIKGL